MSFEGGFRGEGTGCVGDASAAKIDWDTSERRSDARFCDFVKLQCRKVNQYSNKTPETMYRDVLATDRVHQ